MTTANWLSKVNTFGLEIVLPNPIDSNAVISAFNTPLPVLFNIPIPLVAPVAAKFVRLSVAAPISDTVLSGSNKLGFPESIHGEESEYS